MLLCIAGLSTSLSERSQLEDVKILIPHSNFHYPQVIEAKTDDHLCVYLIHLFTKIVIITKSYKTISISIPSLSIPFHNHHYLKMAYDMRRETATDINTITKNMLSVH